MTTLLAWLFWIGVGIVFYTYLGYGLVVFLWVTARRGRAHSAPAEPAVAPAVTLVVPAYNEAATIRAKLENSLQLDYPRDRLTLIFVTDGSTDDTPEQVRSYPAPAGTDLRILHQPARCGKLAAVDRIMPLVTTTITVFSDANALLNPAALRNLVKHYADPTVGAVAGEKRVRVASDSGVQGVGEGIYWKYESTLKRLDAQLYSVVGAAGELFSIRTALYETVPASTIIEDFYLSLRIAMQGHRVAYAPDAYALESHSAALGEEWKRKVRIAAGGLQAIGALPGLLNPLRYGVLSFQYISHRVLRWTVAPLLLPLLFLLNAGLAATGSPFYGALWMAQGVFYTAALAGFLLEKLGVSVKMFYIPFYFCVMNCAVYVGGVRLLRGAQSAVWEKAQRA